MKKQLLSLFFILLTAVFIFNGCDKATDNPVSPGGNTNTSGNASGQPIPTIPNANGVMATIGFSYTIPGVGLSVDYNMGYALFGFPNGTDAGNVSINNNNLTFSSSNNMNYYNSFSQTNPSSLNNVVFNGTAQHNWVVEGKNDIPAINDGIVAPNTFTINNPAANATVTKANGLNVTWTTANSTAQDSVMMVLVSLAGGTPYISAPMPNSGNYTISAASLSGIPAGDAMLQVVKYRYKIVTVSAKNFAIVAEIIKSVSFKVQ